jgi:uncharacterized protein involved in outer membrane biogenesis
MRKAGIAALIIVAVLFLAVLIVPRFINLNQYHTQIQTQLQKRLGRTVTLGQMKLSLLPPSFEVDNAVIGEDNSFNTGLPFGAMDKLTVSVKFWPLLRQEVEIKSLRLDRPRIEMVRNAQGTWNFASLGEQRKPDPAKPEDAGSAGEFTLNNLEIKDGQIAFTNIQKREPRAVYDHIDLTVRNFAPNQEFSIQAAAHLPGQGKQTLSLDGQVGPIQQNDLAASNLSATLTLDQVSLASAAQFLNSPALNGLDAQVSGSMKVNNTGGKFTSSGSIKLDDPHVHDIRVGYPITVDYDVADDLRNDVIDIHRGDLKLGPSPVTIAGTVNAKAAPAQIDLKITAADATIAQAARLASAFGVAFGQSTEVNGRVSADIEARGSASSPALNGRVSAHDVIISGKDLPEPVKAGDIELTLTPATISSNTFTATTGATTITASFALAQYTGPASTINASLRVPSARIAEVLTIAKAYGVAAVEGMTGDGMLALDVRVQGPVKDLSALSFSGTGKIQNANLRMPSLTKPLQIRNADITFSQNSASLQKLTAMVGDTTATGTLTLKNFAAPQVQFTLTADKVNVTELQQLTSAVPAKRAAAGGAFLGLVPSANAEAAGEPGIVSRMTGSGKISIGTLQYDDLTMTNAKSSVSLDHGLIELNPVTAALYGGTESGTVSIDARPAQPVYSVNLKTDKVDANKLMSSVSSMKETLYGALASNVNATFSSSSASTIASGLNGAVVLNLTNGKLMNIDLLHELATLGKFLGLPHTSQGFTNLVQLTGNFDVKNGVAQTNNLKAVIDGGTLAAIGSVDLGSESINMRVTAVLTKALSQQVGGSQIGGYMNTALSNNQGELVFPVIVTGTFQHPKVQPDVKQIAQMRLQNLAPSTKNPGGILSAIMGKDQGDAANGQPQSNQPGANPGQQQNPLGDLLNQALNKNKKKKQPANPPAQKPPK